MHWHGSGEKRAPYFLAKATTDAHLAALRALPQGDSAMVAFPAVPAAPLEPPGGFPPTATEAGKRAWRRAQTLKQKEQRRAEHDATPEGRAEALERARVRMIKLERLTTSFASPFY